MEAGENIVGVMNFELDRTKIKFDRSHCNEGHFGKIYKGTLKLDSGSFQVAVKSCKGQKATEKRFLEEAYMLLKLKHNHIVTAFGVCSQNPVQIVMEWARLGELGEYLKLNKLYLREENQLKYICQVSSALCYLKKNLIVHGDIAARNVMVINVDCVKLTDFGMARKLRGEDEHFTCDLPKLPIKWMSPESMQLRIFNFASDVWSFGVCIWEIMMFGVKPFSRISNDDVYALLSRGERLPKPQDCSNTLYSLMQNCWNSVPRMRQSIDKLSEELYKIKGEGKTFDLRAKDNGYDIPPPPKPIRHKPVNKIPRPHSLPTAILRHLFLKPKPKNFATINEQIEENSTSTQWKHSPLHNHPATEEMTIYINQYAQSSSNYSELLAHTLAQQKQECENDADWLEMMLSRFENNLTISNPNNRATVEFASLPWSPMPFVDENMKRRSTEIMMPG